MHNQTLVIGEFEQRAIGEVLDYRLTDPWCVERDFTGIVIRERDESGWRLCLASFGVTFAIVPCHRRVWFYEVLTD